MSCGAGGGLLGAAVAGAAAPWAAAMAVGSPSFSPTLASHLGSFMYFIMASMPPFCISSNIGFNSGSSCTPYFAVSLSLFFGSGVQKEIACGLGFRVYPQARVSLSKFNMASTPPLLYLLKLGLSLSRTKAVTQQHKCAVCSQIYQPNVCRCQLVYLNFWVVFSNHGGNYNHIYCAPFAIGALGDDNGDIGFASFHIYSPPHPPPSLYKPAAGL